MLHFRFLATNNSIFYSYTYKYMYVYLFVCILLRRHDKATEILKKKIDFFLFRQNFKQRKFLPNKLLHL